VAGALVLTAFAVTTSPAFASPAATSPAFASPDDAPPVVPVAGPGVTSPPVWFPLRGTWLVGCTWANGCDGHHGRPAIDLATDRSGSGAGAPVFAAGAGQAFVTSRGDGCDSGGGTQGNTVEVAHGDGTRSIYTHLQSVEVADGTWVDPTTVLGTVGNSGWSSPCSFHHLHFEVTTSGVSVDPGPLWACANGVGTTYPAGGQWATVPQWTAMTSDGPGCPPPVDPAPMGRVDAVAVSADRTLRISGWMLAPGDAGADLTIAVRWRGPVGGTSGVVTVATTPVGRPDIAWVQPGSGDDVGFEAAVTMPARARSVEVLAVNTVTGATTSLGRLKVAPPRDLPDTAGVGGASGRGEPVANPSL
jgi:hypothetical protein